jgi:uncharacterized protein (TIGR00369 family)
MTEDSPTSNDSAGRPELQELYEAGGFVAQLGARIEAITDGFARVRLPYQELNTTARQALHGGAIAALLDLTGTVAAMSTADPSTNSLTAMTMSCHVSFLAGAIGEDIFGEGRVLRRGKEIVYSDVFVVNGEGKQLAQGSHVCRVFDPKIGGTRQ